MAERPLIDGRDPVELAAELRRRRDAGERVGLTHGCFDLLHPGNVDLLSRAAAEADVLVVAVNDDASAHRLEGRGRPIVPLRERLEILAALRCVDYTVAFSEDRPLSLIAALRPEVLIQRRDWPDGRLVHAEHLEGWGGRVVSLPLRGDHSTARLIQVVREL